MGYITTFILLLLSFFLKKKHGTWFSPDVLFCIEWFAICFMASLHLYSMYEASILAWFIILSGSLSFCIGVNMSIGSFNIRRNICNYSLGDSKPLIKPKWFFVLFFGVLISYIPLLIQSIILLKSGVDMDELRHAYSGDAVLIGYERSTGPIAAIINYLQAFGYMLVVANGIFMFVKSHKITYLLAGITLVAIDTIISGGRFNIAYFVVELIICFELFKKSKKENRVNGKVDLKTKLIVGFTIIVFAFVFVYITFLRGAAVDEISQKYYRYFCGCVVHFDVRIPLLEKDDIWYMGLASFYGLTNMIFPVLHVFGIPYPEAYKKCTENVNDTQEFMQIGSDMQTNAFVTPFYHLYADGRIIAVIVGMVFFGIIAGKIFKNIIVRESGASVIFYLIICQMIFATLYAYPFVSLGNGLFLIIWLFYWRKIKTI